MGMVSTVESFKAARRYLIDNGAWGYLPSVHDTSDLIRWYHVEKPCRGLTDKRNHQMQYLQGYTLLEKIRDLFI
jgi:hypothetical protein